MIGRQVPKNTYISYAKSSFVDSKQLFIDILSPGALLLYASFLIEVQCLDKIGGVSSVYNIYRDV